MTDGMAIVTCLTACHTNTMIVSPSLKSRISFHVATVHGEYAEYVWRVKIQALDCNCQRIRHYFWQGLSGASSFCGLYPATVLLAAYNVTCRGILSRNDSLQEQLLLASKRKLYLNF